VTAPRTDQNGSPIVSVVIPMYNARSWIRETLESVRAQTYPDKGLELLVLDDGSGDDSALIARTFLDEHAMRGEVIAGGRNAGVGATRNAGWRRASGEWIQFLDADDLLAPRKIEVQASHAARVPGDVAVIYSPWRRIGPHEGGWQPTGPLVSSAVDDDTVVRILEDLDFGYVGPALIRRAFLCAIGGFNERLNLGEDLDLMLRIAMVGGRFQAATSTEALFFYRQTPGSLWQQSFARPEAIAGLARVFRRAERFLRDRAAEGPTEAARRALARRYARRLDVLFESDRRAFREIVGWIRGLGLAFPPGTTRKWRLLSRLIGYENAQALRLSGRRANRWLGGRAGLPRIRRPRPAS
jgi:glycosyltransferase involved in cell wall biosynthesis